MATVDFRSDHKFMEWEPDLIRLSLSLSVEKFGSKW